MPPNLLPLRNCIVLLFLLWSFAAKSQADNKNSLSDHLYHINTLTGAKDSAYQKILNNYERHLKHSPNNIAVAIAKCRFIEGAYNEEEYNPKYDEFVACVNSLADRFPEHPDVLLFKMETMYGDSTREFLLNLIELREKNPEPWQGKPFWLVYERLAREYDEENTTLALEYADKAIQENDTLDLTILIANQHIKENRQAKAKEVLISKISEKNPSWELNQKGKLLLDLGAPSEALEAFRLARKDTSGWINEKDLAQALIENGLASDARGYLVTAAEGTWTHPGTLIALLEYDLKYRHDSASVTYRKLVGESFWYDAVGVYRVRLLLSDPLAGWKLSDVLRIVMLLLCLATVVILPYTWILPINFLGTRRHFNRQHDIDTRNDIWTLRDFWVLSSLVFFNHFLTAVVLDYSTWILAYTSNEAISVDEVNLGNANSALFFTGVNTLILFFFLKREVFQNFWGDSWTRGKSVAIAIGAVFGLKFASAIYYAIVNQLPWPEDLSSLAPLLSTNDSIISINKYYHPALGFLDVVILAPIYEEFFFRGIVFAGVRKHMNFIWANIIQAALFATVHWELKLFPFYFAFAIIAGYYRNKSGSLAPGIIFHIVNNLLAFFAILMTWKLREGL